MDKYAIHWFRRDLRIQGNPGLAKSFKEFQGRVLGFFCFDPVFLSREDFSHNRFQLFLQRIKELKKEMRLCGGDLLVLDQGPAKAFVTLFDFLKNSKNGLPSAVTFCRDYEPFARERDERIKKIFEQYQIDHFDFRDHLLIEPHELTKDNSIDGYQVFTPFSRKWNALFETELIQSRTLAQKKSLDFLRDLANDKFTKIFDLSWNKLQVPFKDCLDQYLESNLKKTTIKIPEINSRTLYEGLKDFEKKINDYSDARDIPSLQGTSQFSLYLKNGSLTISQIIAYFDLKPYYKATTSRDKFLSELIWREFYYHILHRYPRVEHEAFNEKYKDIKWINDPALFEAWKEGKTGFPIVDAGMRQLKSTGWMHNRVRMIVASFLTKDLLIDWKWGERYFMQELLDGDLAPNNGGWQWAASTGCDPQPYFRIFNPWSQSERFDPEAIYIKHFVPELADVPTELIHRPLNIKGYPQPIVDHSLQREKALKIYKVLN